MKLLKHDKKYKDGVLEDTIVKLSLDTKKDKIDNIIYYLICSQDKLNNNETIGSEARLISAFEKLNEYIKKDIR